MTSGRSNGPTLSARVGPRRPQALALGSAAPAGTPRDFGRLPGRGAVTHTVAQIPRPARRAVSAARCTILLGLASLGAACCGPAGDLAVWATRGRWQLIGVDTLRIPIVPLRQDTLVTLDSVLLDPRSIERTGAIVSARVRNTFSFQSTRDHRVTGVLHEFDCERGRYRTWWPGGEMAIMDFYDEVPARWSGWNEYRPHARRLAEAARRVCARRRR